MDERGQFTFYRSFWEAVQSLPNKDQLPVLKAIISYALDGVTPTGLSQSQSAFFLLVKPNLDASRKKAANGKQGGSKPKANGKQNESKPQAKKEKEKENEIEVEEENEIENEYECNIRGRSSSAGAEATADELASIGLNPSQYRGVSSDMVNLVQDIGWKLFSQYTPTAAPAPADLRKVYDRLCWRRQGEDLENGIGLLGYAFDAAHKAGKPCNWNYINAVLDRCTLENIYSPADAIRRDALRGVDE